MDQARKKTDKKLLEMEKKISNIYKEAYDDISKEWDAFMKSHYKKLNGAREDLKKAEASGDRDEIRKAKDLYERTAKNITVNNRRYQSMINDITEKIAHTNEIALNYVNDQLPEIYTVNYNAFGDENISGYSFSLTNEGAVKQLATTDKTLLPTKKLDIPKDMAWNQKQINSQMLQSIIQGESIPKMAKRLQNVTDMDRKSAIRNARTMTTAAENKGRQDSFVKATKDGVIMKREWVATFDERTRAWHAELDGVQVEVDEPWENDYGEIMEPGDPTADPANVYNCRCAMRARILGFDWNKGSEKTVGSVAESNKDIRPGKIAQNIVNKITKKQSAPIATNTITEKLEKAGVKRVPVSKYDTIPSMQDIINKVSGGDETAGSCLSAAYTYCAQRNGLDALDFRGGKSREIFSHLSEEMAKLFNGTITRGFNELEVALEALNNIEKNQEYILAAGRHAAVVKKTGKYYQYLELQNPDLHYNRWCPLDQSSLKSRFSCDPNDNEDGIIVSLVSRNSLKDNKDFESILEYINTNEKKQKKGLHGSIK